MKCLLVFDYLNDIIYTKYNKKFALHINSFAKIQGLLTEEQVCYKSFITVFSFQQTILLVFRNQIILELMLIL